MVEDGTEVGNDVGPTDEPELGLIDIKVGPLDVDGSMDGSALGSDVGVVGSKDTDGSNDTDGSIVSVTVGSIDGLVDGTTLGSLETDGSIEGSTLGLMDDSILGIEVWLGSDVGCEGLAVGVLLGRRDGNGTGRIDGAHLGILEGTTEGSILGCSDGAVGLNDRDGTKEGSKVGAIVGSVGS